MTYRPNNIILLWKQGLFSVLQRQSFQDVERVPFIAQCTMHMSLGTVQHLGLFS